MAGEATVVVEDDTEVTIELDAGDGVKIDAKTVDDDTGKKKDGEADGVVKTADQTTQQRTRTPAAADEAAAALTDAMKKQESALATAEAERRARVDAEARAASKETEIAQLREQNVDQQAVIIDNEIKRISADMAAARADLKHAKEAADFDKEADLQVKIGELGGELAVQKANKTAHETAKKSRPAQTTEGRVQQQQSQPALDRYLSGFTPKAQAWMRARPECVPAELGGDPVKNASMMEGHYAALRQKAAEGSDDYYRIIEEHVGYRQPAVSLAADTKKAGEEEPAPAQRQQQPQRRAQPSAPVTRDSTDGTVRQTATTMKLDKEMQEVALFSFPAKAGESEADHRKRAFGTYAREYIKAKDEGKIGRSTH